MEHMEALAVAISTQQDHRRSLDSAKSLPQNRTSDTGLGTSFASSLSTSLFGLSPRPSAGYMPLERTSSSVSQTTVSGSLFDRASLDRPSYTGDDFESFVQGYASSLKIPPVSAPVPVPTRLTIPGSAPCGGARKLEHTASLPLRFHNVSSPVFGRAQAKATGDIDMYWRSMYQE